MGIAGGWIAAVVAGIVFAVGASAGVIATANKPPPVPAKFVPYGVR